MLADVARGSPFGRVILVSGPEALLADRAVEGLRAQIRTVAPEAELTEIEAARLDPAKLAEVTNPSLFADRRAAVITDLASLPADLYASVIALADTPVADLAVVLV